MRFRRHWLSIFNPTWSGLLVAAVLCCVFLPGQLRQAWPTLRPFLPHGLRISVVSAMLSYAIFCLLVFGVMSFLTALGWWYFTRIVLDEVWLTVRMPLASNSIPLAAIQDVQTARPMVGVLFGYGTLIIMSGKETENIDFVPDVESVARTLSHRKT
jgi:hypothetical protein